MSERYDETGAPRVWLLGFARWVVNITRHLHW